MTQNPDIIQLPPRREGESESLPGRTRRVTIIGANGAGKSRFMGEMIALCGERACRLSVLSNVFPGEEEGENSFSTAEIFRIAPTLSYDRLAKVKRLWSEIFPGAKIIMEEDRMMFANTSGRDLIDVGRLSQGEKTALYYAVAVSVVPEGSVVFVDSPSLFLHPSIIGHFWNAVERLRKDVMFVYNSVDVDFVSSRSGNLCIWVRSYDPSAGEWDYDILPDSSLTEELFVELMGSRRPVLFIEGDNRHSIDARLYSLVFKDWTVRPLGSCNKVIETTRTFNDLKYMHHLRSRGIVDRDRRTEQEVGYLRKKEIMVPEVAEIENIFMLPCVIRAMAVRRGKNPDKVLNRVEHEVIGMFRSQADRQALQHVRHRVKREVECKIDARFSCITALETHLKTLVYQLQPRKYYNQLRDSFSRMIAEKDYHSILRVFNHKAMLPNSGLHQLLGFRTKDHYIDGVLDFLREDCQEAEKLRKQIRHCLRADEMENLK